MTTCNTQSPEETIAIAKTIAGYVRPGDIFCLYGDLGAGKTTWVRGFVSAIQQRAKVSSPTFVLMNIYDGKVPIYHFDLYRIDADELWNMGYEEFFYGKGITLIEWSERLGDLLPKEHFVIDICHVAEHKRRIFIKAHGQECKQRLKGWKL